MENKDVKILIVDDEKHINRLIQINLERTGYKTVSAYDGEEALKLVESEKPNTQELGAFLQDIVRLGNKTQI